MFITWLWIRAVSPLPAPAPSPARTAPHRALPWRGGDDSNCMYYTTTCNTMGHGSIGLTLSTDTCLPARLAFALALPASHRPARSEDDTR